MTSNKTSFAKYKEGYVDGYDGNTVQMPNDDNYLRGYADGKEDDQSGAPSKFPERTQD